MIEQQKKELGVTEELKEKNQMKWVGLMNNIIQSAEEIVLAEIVYD
ncbi:MAG: TnpV protein [Acutalibacteraceae bacterium]|nr:TnpV protein [Acutalibacteraceae bacterium]